MVESYKRIKDRDPTRPVFLNLTAGFMEMGGKKLSDEKRQYYQTVAAGADRTTITPQLIERAEWVAGLELSEEDRKTVAGILTESDLLILAQTYGKTSTGAAPASESLSAIVDAVAKKRRA